MLGKNCSKKVPKNVFYIHTKIVTKKWGEKTREKIFPEHTYSIRKNVGKQIFGKKCEKTFFRIIRMS